MRLIKLLVWRYRLRWARWRMQVAIYVATLMTHEIDRRRREIDRMCSEAERARVKAAWNK